MKKLLAALLVLTLCLSCVVGFAETAEAKNILYLCLNLGDLSFNDMGWEGCQAAAEKYGWTAQCIELGKVPPYTRMPSSTPWTAVITTWS